MALVLGGLTLWLALPRIMASAVLAIRAPVIQKVDGGEPVAAAELLGLVASRELALGWVEDRETHDERATALARLAFDEEPRSAAQKAALERAAHGLRAGLAVAPGAPKDWMQLADLLVMIEGDANREAAQALLASIRTGPFQAPDLFRRRLFWSLAHLAFYDDGERREIDEQVRLAWQISPDELLDLAYLVPEFAAPIGAALDPIPGAREQFVTVLDFPPPSRAMAPLATGDASGTGTSTDPG